MVKVLAAIAGGVLGFVGGIFLAAKAGLYEREHVFSVAVVCGAVLGAIAMLGTKRLVARATGWHSDVLTGFAVFLR